jgi:hypothetical protein
VPTAHYEGLSYYVPFLGRRPVSLKIIKDNLYNGDQHRVVCPVKQAIQDKILEEYIALEIKGCMTRKESYRP